MKPAVAPRSRSLRFAITPMIDIVFLLIIFFLVTTHFVKSENLEPIELPNASQAEDPENDSPRRITITVRADGQYVIGGRVTEWTEVEARLLSIEQGPQDEPESPMEVRIRGDAQAQYRRIRPILETCAQAGLTKIRFAVMPEEGD